MNSYTYLLSGGAVLFLLIGFLPLWKKIFKHVMCQIKLIKVAFSLPGPTALPLIGNALDFDIGFNDILDQIMKIVERNSEPTFRFWLGPKLIVVTRDPDNFKIILSSAKAINKDPIYQMKAPFIGQGLITGSGPIHKMHRKLITPMINSSKILSEYFTKFMKYSKICVECLEDQLLAGEFDILPFITNCTSDMMFNTVFGIDGAIQRNGNFKQFVHWSDYLYELVYLRMIKVWLHPDFVFYRTEMGKEQLLGLEIIHGTIDNIIIWKRKERLLIQKGIKINESETSGVAVIDQLMEDCMKNNSMTDRELRDELYTLYLASQDTTALQSSFVLLMLAMHPDVQDKVRDELKSTLRSSDDEIDENSLSNLKYLEMVICETLRLFPVAPFLLRKTTGDIKLNNLTLPENCTVLMAPLITHKDEKYWGSDAHKFLPERFAPENVKDRHPYAYIPFSSGTRGCIGRKYAMMCLKVLIATLISNYYFKTNQTMSDIKLKTDISIRSQNGYRVSIEKIQLP